MRETWRSPKGKKHLSYSPEFAEKVIKLFDEGMASIDIARQTDMKGYMIRLILKRHGRKPSERQRHGSPYPEEKVAEVVAFYRDCKSTRETGEHFGIHTRVVRELLIKNGSYEPEWQEKEIPEEDAKAIVEEWNAGKPLARIAIDRGIGKARLKRLLIDNGIVPQERKLRGTKHGSWEGGRFEDKQGYWWTYITPDDPMAIMAVKGRYIAEHRLVMARAIGRPLERNETVHHINGDRKDNRLENLQLRHGGHGKGIVLKCADCGGHNIIEVPLTAQELKEQEGKP